jgi:ubiquinone/menaquinone biosynthesis C-methylase UbiE
VSKLNRIWDRFAKGYAKRPIDDEDAYQEKLRVTRTYFKPGMEVLEFGCGTGSTAIAQAPFVKHILAIDFSAKMLEIAREKAAAAGVRNVTFEQSGIEEFHAPDQTYDVIMAHSILHLLEDKDMILAKMFGLLKPGGVLVSSTICMSARLHPARVILPIGRFLGLLPLVKFFSVQELVDSINGAGFEIVHQWQPGPKAAVFIVATKAV